MDSITDTISIAHDAGATRVPPWMALVSALAAARPDGFAATVDWLVANREALEGAYREGAAARIALSRLPPEMQYQPELGGLDLARQDHALRGRYVFADLVGERSFFQTAVYAITGLDLPARHAAMLEQVGVINLTVDARVWPLAASRRVAARGGGYQAAVVAGVAMMGSPVLAGAAAADCARFLQRARAAVEDGGTVEALVVDLLARRERVMGFGRPTMDHDERVPVMQALLREHGRADLPFVGLLREAEAAFLQYRGLRTTAAAWAAAILCDFGLSPDAVHAVSNFWVTTCVFAQSLFSGERGLIAPAV